MVLLICIKRYNKEEDFFVFLENLRNQGEILKKFKKRHCKANKAFKAQYCEVENGNANNGNSNKW